MAMRSLLSRRPRGMLMAPTLSIACQLACPASGQPDEGKDGTALAVRT